MDGSQFDRLVRELATGRSRRSVVKAAGAAVLGALGLAGAGRGVEAAPSCTPAGPKYVSRCTNDDQCCAGLVCQRGRCLAGCRIGGRTFYASGASDRHNQCQTCQPGTSTTSFTNQADGTSCTADKDPCTVETCQAGVCVGAPRVCTTTNPCQTAGCDRREGCVTHNRAAGTACGDGDPCNGAETCDGAGHCVAGTPVSCGPCAACDPTSGQCAPANEGGACPGDGNRCVGGFVCRGGSCVGTTTVVCTASDQCHAAGTCDPATGTCSNPDQPDGTSCNDGNACTQTDNCQGGVCTGGNPLNCDDGDPCTIDTCDPATGGCSSTAVPGCCTSDAQCPDGDADPCTVAACVDHACSSAPVPGCCTSDAQCAAGLTCSGNACVSIETPVCPPSHLPDHTQLCRSMVGAPEADRCCLPDEYCYTVPDGSARCCAAASIGGFCCGTFIPPECCVTC